MSRVKGKTMDVKTPGTTTPGNHCQSEVDGVVGRNTVDS